MRHTVWKRGDSSGWCSADRAAAATVVVARGDELAKHRGADGAPIRASSTAVDRSSKWPVRAIAPSQAAAGSMRMNRASSPWSLAAAGNSRDDGTHGGPNKGMQPPRRDGRAAATGGEHRGSGDARRGARLMPQTLGRPGEKPATVGVRLNWKIAMVRGAGPAVTVGDEVKACMD